MELQLKEMIKQGINKVWVGSLAVAFDELEFDESGILFFHKGKEIVAHILLSNIKAIEPVLTNGMILDVKPF